MAEELQIRKTLQGELKTGQACVIDQAVVVADIRREMERQRKAGFLNAFEEVLYECMKVSCKYLRDIFERTKDVDKLNYMVSQSQYAHCRIGLARKFLIQENHCYLMLNGLFLY